jgi:uncharacterized heparinase superfamily protein
MAVMKSSANSPPRARTAAAKQPGAVTAGGEAQLARFLSVLRRPRWYAARLADMPPAEIPHRIAEARRRIAWRRDARGWQAFAGIGDGALGDFFPLRARLGRGAAVTACGNFAQRVREAGEDRFSFLGKRWLPVTVRPGRLFEIPPAFWFHDPISGQSWPGASTSSFDINVRSTGNGLGDVKYVWEANRLQMLHPLAAMYAASCDQEIRETALAIIGSWAAANPPYRGINWTSGIELALRLVSIALVVAAIGPSALLADERVVIRRIVAAHARYIAAFPSLYSSANNHRIAEGLGLFLAGLLLPDMEEASAWHDDGRRILETEAARQILADGVGAEQSPTYQAFSMEMLALAAQFADDAGTPFEARLIKRLVRGAEFLSRLADKNGLVPAIGDDDEGRVIAQPPDREPRYVASVIAAIAGLARRADLAACARDPHVRDAIFLSPQPKPTTRSGLRIFQEGGISIIDDTINCRCVHLVFDHGPLGLMPLAAHGHADALAIWLAIDGEPLFIDAGTFAYYSAGETRSALRESLAHNTLAIEDVSHSRTATAFGWRRTANARLDGAGDGPAWWVAGAHDGYGKSFGVHHVRKIRRTEFGFAIDDQLLGARAPLAVTLRFVCHPEIKLATDNGAIRITSARGQLCRLAPPHRFSTNLTAAMHSQRFGHLAPAPQLILMGELADEAVTTFIEIIEPGVSRCTHLPPYRRAGMSV